VSGNQYVGVHVYGERSRGIVRENDIRDNSLAAVVTEHGGVVQSADNRIDGVHETELAFPAHQNHPQPDIAMPEVFDISFRGKEHDMTMHSPNSSPTSVKPGAAEFSSSSAMSNCVQVEVVGATDLPKINGFGLANPFVSISLFGPDMGPASTLMSIHDAIKVPRVHSCNPAFPLSLPPSPFPPRPQTQLPARLLLLPSPRRD